ncbi:PATS1-like protein [Mya arenaria]|uniref:PATS1-like protein n=1 Tax=Mya arenaria TaxID=6604 RepID=A0ABY7EZH7_MYAAR|nr:PATS1-like protein [Mya arenaria]
MMKKAKGKKVQQSEGKKPLARKTLPARFEEYVDNEARPTIQALANPETYEGPQNELYALPTTEAPSIQSVSKADNVIQHAPQRQLGPRVEPYAPVDFFSVMEKNNGVFPPPARKPVSRSVKQSDIYKEDIGDKEFYPLSKALARKATLVKSNGTDFSLDFSGMYQLTDFALFCMLKANNSAKCSMSVSPLLVTKRTLYIFTVESGEDPKLRAKEIFGHICLILSKAKQEMKAVVSGLEKVCELYPEYQEMGQPLHIFLTSDKKDKMIANGVLSLSSAPASIEKHMELLGTTGNAISLKLVDETTPIWCSVEWLSNVLTVAYSSPSNPIGLVGLNSDVSLWRTDDLKKKLVSSGFSSDQDYFFPEIPPYERQKADFYTVGFEVKFAAPMPRTILGQLMFLCSNLRKWMMAWKEGAIFQEGIAESLIVHDSEKSDGKVLSVYCHSFKKDRSPGVMKKIKFTVWNTIAQFRKLLDFVLISNDLPYEMQLLTEEKDAISGKRTDVNYLPDALVNPLISHHIYEKKIDAMICKNKPIDVSYTDGLTVIDMEKEKKALTGYIEINLIKSSIDVSLTDGDKSIPIDATKLPVVGDTVTMLLDRKENSQNQELSIYRNSQCIGTVEVPNKYSAQYKPFVTVKKAAEFQVLPYSSRDEKQLSTLHPDMRLEAIDKKNPSKVFEDGKVQIHFDGWGDNYDYVTTMDDPALHPIGWMDANKQNNKHLTQMLQSPHLQEFSILQRFKTSDTLYEFFSVHNRFFCLLPRNFSMSMMKYPSLQSVMDYSHQNVHVLCPGLKMDVLHLVDDAGFPLPNSEIFSNPQNAKYLINCIAGLALQPSVLPSSCSNLVLGYQGEAQTENIFLRLLFMYINTLDLNAGDPSTKTGFSAELMDVVNSALKDKDVSKKFVDGDNIRCIGHANSSLANQDIKEINLAEYSQLYNFLTRIDFQNNQLETLPDEFFTSFVVLESLNLSKNKIEKLPSGIGKLKEITEINVAHNKLTELPSDFAGLKETLLFLDISHNPLNHLPHNVSFLTKLEELHAENVGNVDLSDVIKLKQLTVLNVGYNLINSIPDQLGELPLEYLNLSGVPWIPESNYPSIVMFTKALSSNNVTNVMGKEEMLKLFSGADVDESSDLSKQEVVALNQTTLLKKYPRLGLKGLTFEKKLNLKNCYELNTPPKEIVSRGFVAVMGYLKRLRLGSIPCKRTKLMMVGLGGADHDEPITDGIQIKSWEIPVEDDKVTYSVWDFAGQTVYYNTHQGVEALRNIIVKLTLQQKYMGEKIPEAYLTLEKKIIQLKQEKNLDIMPFKSMESVAATCGIFDRNEMVQAIQFLHDLGAVQFFDTDFLRSMVVIYPQWIVDVMACLVTVHEGAVQVRLNQYSSGSLMWKTGSYLKKNNHIALMLQTDDREVIVRAQGFRPENFIFIVHEMIESLINESYAGVKYDFQIPCKDCLNMNVKDPSMMSYLKVVKALELNVPFIQCDKFFHISSIQDLKESMPSDKLTNMDSHLQSSVRELKDLNTETKISTFFMYTSKNVPSADQAGNMVHPAKIYEDLRSKEFLNVSYTDRPETMDMEALTLTLKSTSVIIVGMSDEFCDNPECKKVLLYLKDVLHKPILLVLLGTTKKWQKGDMNYSFGTEVYVDMQNKTRYPHKIKELYEAIKKKEQAKVQKNVKKTSPKCFISYCWSNSHDAVLVKKSKQIEGALGWEKSDPRVVKSFLENQGVSCWLDVEQTGGVGVLAVGNKCKQVFMQMENEAGYLQVLKLVQDNLKNSKSSGEEKQSAELQRNVAFQEVLELTQRKLLRHITSNFINIDLEPYPNLFVIDFISEKERQRPLTISKEDSQSPESEKRKPDVNVMSKSKYVFRLLCEHLGGWHIVPTTIPFPDNLDPEEEKMTIENAAPYLSRIYTILKHANVKLECLVTPDGEIFQQRLEEIGVNSSDFKESYLDLRNTVINQDKAKSLAALQRCHVNGKMVWLCDEHKNASKSMTESRYQGKISAEPEKNIPIGDMPESFAGEVETESKETTETNDGKEKKRIFRKHLSSQKPSLNRQTSQMCSVM